MKIEPEGLTLRTEPLSPAELQEAQAKSGKKILITCPSTLKQLSEGALSFVVKKDETEKPVAYRLEVGGARLGRIGVMGDSLDPSGKIKFGQLLVGEGKQAVYTVKVRTKNRELKTRSIQTVPSMVHVSLEPVPGIDPSAGIYKMLVEVPKDSPEQSYMGKNHGNIHIEFEDENHPTLDLKLDFSIVKAKSIE